MLQKCQRADLNDTRCRNVFKVREPNAGMDDSPDVLKVKSDWQLEIQLDCCTLVLSANGVFDLDVDL